tara:strand:- start:720 stop:1022 length:303 start_codon:yes stop_codon:yes gene_type:complete
MSEYVMREFNVLVWYHPEDVTDGDYSLGVADESYEIATLAEAIKTYDSIKECFHKMLLHYPNWNLCEYGGDGNVLIEGSSELEWSVMSITDAVKIIKEEE